MRPRAAKKGRTWANDDTLEQEDKRGKTKVKAKVLAVPNKKTGGDGMMVTKTHVTFEDSDEELYDEMPNKDNEAKAGETETGENVDANVDGDEEDLSEERDTTAHDSGLSDLDYLRSKMKKLDEDELENDKEADEDAEEDIAQEGDAMEVDETAASSAPPASSNVHASRMALFDNPEDAASSPTTNDPTQPATNSQPPHQPITIERPSSPPPADIISDTGRLFVKNLPYSCAEEDLHTLFEKYGPLSEVHIPIDKNTKKPRGYAFILFLLPEHAVKAFTELDGQIFQGRILEVLPGKERPKAAEEEGNGNGTFKSQREKQKKKDAGNEFSWNSLFMNVSSTSLLL